MSLAVALLACDGTDNRHPVPYVLLSETIFLNSPSAFDLQFVGGVYDLRCPNHVSQPCGASKVVEGLYAECACDGQRFLLFDGSATSGSTAWGLLPYRVQYDGVSLQISNL